MTRNQSFMMATLSIFVLAILGCAASSGGSSAKRTVATSSVNEELLFAVDGLAAAAQRQGVSVEYLALDSVGPVQTLAAYENAVTRARGLGSESKIKLNQVRSEFVKNYGCARLADDLISAQDQLGILIVDGSFVRQRKTLNVIRLKFAAAEQYDAEFDSAAQRAGELRRAVVSDCGK